MDAEEQTARHAPSDIGTDHVAASELAVSRRFVRPAFATQDGCPQSDLCRLAFAHMARPRVAACVEPMGRLTSPSGVNGHA